MKKIHVDLRRLPLISLIKYYIKISNNRKFIQMKQNNKIHN